MTGGGWGGQGIMVFTMGVQCLSLVIFQCENPPPPPPPYPDPSNISVIKVNVHILAKLN